MAFLIDKSPEGRHSVLFPHIGKVPKGLERNLLLRERMKRSKNRSEQKELLRLASEDCLFFINVFGWMLQQDPVPDDIPFITDPYQDDAIRDLRLAEENRERVHWEKSRKMGATKGAMVWILWGWRFHRKRVYLVGSRTKELVDDSGDPDSLLQMFDCSLRLMPAWAHPIGWKFSDEDCSRRFHRKNPENDSLVHGEAVTDKFGRQRRAWVAMIDEFSYIGKGPTDNMDAAAWASVSRTSECTIAISTPSERGEQCEFARLRHTSIRKIRSHWTQNPRLCTDFHVDEVGKPHSKEYDRAVAEATDPAVVAREWDINYGASAGPYYMEWLKQKVERECEANLPLSIGELELDTGKADGAWVKEFLTGGMARLSLWVPLVNGRPPRDTYWGVAADVAAGTSDSTGRGASNTILKAVNRITGVVAAEYVICGVLAHKIVRYFVAMARWFADPQGNPAMAIWDAIGPGGTLYDTIRDDLEFNHFYYELAENLGRCSDRRRATKIGKPGFHKSSSNQAAFFGDHRQMLVDGRFTERSVWAAREMGQYRHDPVKVAVHSGAYATKDPSGARENHGDRVITSALLCRILADYPMEGAKAPKLPAPEGSLQYFEDLEQEDALRSPLDAVFSSV